MFGRTLKLALLVGVMPMLNGCCLCTRPWFCHGFCGGYAAGTPCSSCYTPGAAPYAAAPYAGPTAIPGPGPVVPISPAVSAPAGNPTIDKIPSFSSATYTHPTR